MYVAMALDLTTCIAMHHRMPYFPRALYGDASVTRRAWRQLLQTAWAAGTFDVVESSEMIPITGECDVIIDMIPPHNFKSHQLHWWMLWVAKDRPSRIKTARLKGESSKVFQDAVIDEWDLVCDGLRFLWCTVGMLSGLSHERLYDYEIVFGKRALRKRVFVPLLRQYIAWLPELVVLHDRFASTSIRYRHIPNFRHVWFAEILGVFYRLGYKRFRGKDWGETIDRMYHGSVTEATVANGFVVKRGERFELCE